MKVDSYCLENASREMESLLRMLNKIAEQAESAQKGLRSCMKDGNLVSDLILTSLTSQIRELEQRIEGMGRLAKVLRALSEEYDRCEGAAMEAAGVIVYYATGLIPFEPIHTELKPIPPITEIRAIESTIIPMLKI